MFRLLTTFALLLSAIGAAAVSASAGTLGQSDLEGEAAEMAVELSRLEANGEYGTLYNLMHLDAQAIIPPRVVGGWYRDEFAPRQPGVITEVTDVRIISWVWPVNGITYLETAEVTFEQPFDAEVEEDTIHLVREQDEWRWFFGSSLDFVNNQIARYTPEYPPLSDVAETALATDGIVSPWGLDAVTTGELSPESFAEALPSEFVDNTLQDEPRSGETEEQQFPFATESLTYRYTGPSDPGMPTALVNLSALQEDVSAADAMVRIKEDGLVQSDLVVRLEGNDPTAQVQFLLVEQFGGEAVGDVPYLFWGATDGDWIYMASTRDLASLRVLVEGIVSTLQRSTVLGRA